MWFCIWLISSIGFQARAELSLAAEFLRMMECCRARSHRGDLFRLSLSLSGSRSPLRWAPGWLLMLQ